MELQFNLKGSFKTSDDASPAAEVIGEFINEANETILKKGAPEGEGASVVEWNIDGNKINFIIESGRYVRAHDALLRMRKPLAKKLGKDYAVLKSNLLTSRYHQKTRTLVT